MNGILPFACRISILNFTSWKYRLTVNSQLIPTVIGCLDRSEFIQCNGPEIGQTRLGYICLHTSILEVSGKLRPRFEANGTRICILRRYFKSADDGWSYVSKNVIGKKSDILCVYCCLHIFLSYIILQITSRDLGYFPMTTHASHLGLPLMTLYILDPGEYMSNFLEHNTILTPLSHPTWGPFH